MAKKDLQGLERRQHDRSLVEDVFFVLSNSMRVGAVRNISKGGMLVSFIKRKKSTIPLSEVSIYANTPPQFHLKGIPCSVVREYSAEGIGSLEIKYCGLRFDRLSSLHLSRLEELVDRYSICSP